LAKARAAQGKEGESPSSASSQARPSTIALAELTFDPGVGKALRELNRLIEAHNRYYPIEANLPLDPATGLQLDRGVGVVRPWRPLPPVTLAGLIADATRQA
jgi:hypothetical protein